MGMAVDPAIVDYLTQKGKQIGRQTDRQVEDRYAGRQAGGQTGRQEDKPAGQWTDIQTYR
jgi:hypothetical protein